MQLQLTRFMSNPNNLSLVRSDVEESVLAGGYCILSGEVKVLLLHGEATNLFLTECLMRGVGDNVVITEPGKKVYAGSMCYFLHAPNEYPDYDDDGYVWIRRP